MKKLLTFFVVLAISAFASCEENNGDNINPNDKTEQPEEKPDNDNEDAEKPNGGSGDDSGEITNLPPANEIWYTSTNNDIVTPYHEINWDGDSVFGANVVSNTYEDGKGVISFDGDVTHIGYWAFYECSTLASITIPNSVSSIGANVFATMY